MEEDYEKHSRRIKDIINRKAGILDQVNPIYKYNKLVNEKRTKSLERAVMMRASTSHGTKALPNMKFFDKCSLRTDNMFKMNFDEVQREVNKIHNDLFSSSYFKQLGFDTMQDEMEHSTNVTVITSMSNTSNFDFRKADIEEDTKYIKEPQPYGNPFRLIIRPKNQNIQMSEIEDEAFMTSVEKKKANRLASYANLYKQQLTNQLKKYGEWFRANQDPTALNLRVKELQVKRENDRDQLIKREQEIKKKFDKEKKFLDKRDPEDMDSIDSMEGQVHESIAVLKPEKLVLKNDHFSFQASEMLFDDLYELMCRLKYNTHTGEDLKITLKSQLMTLSAKYQDQFDSHFLTQKFEEFSSSYFGYSW